MTHGYIRVIERLLECRNNAEFYKLLLWGQDLDEEVVLVFGKSTKFLPSSIRLVIDSTLDVGEMSRNLTVGLRSVLGGVLLGLWSIGQYPWHPIEILVAADLLRRTPPRPNVYST